MFRGRESAARKQASASEGRHGEGVLAATELLSERGSGTKTPPAKDGGFGSLDLEGVRFGDAPSEPSVANIPQGVPQKNGRSPTS
jgi:hypothetical protein